MKRFFVLLAAVATLASCNSNKCDMVGALDNFDGEGMAYLTNVWEARAVVDSVMVKDNRFHLKNVKHEPFLAQLVMSGGRPIAVFFVEPGKIVIEGDCKLGTVKASGTPSNDAFAAMMKQNEDVMARYRQAVAAKDKEAIEAIEKEHEARIIDLCEQNKGNVFGLFLLQQLSYSTPSKEVIEKIAQLPEHLQNLSFTKRMKETAERKLKTEPQTEGSDYVPYYINVEQPDAKEKMVSLKSVVENKKNRYVLLDFWASWCSPCMAEMPYLKEAYKLYHKKGFEIYGVSLDSRKESWLGAIEKQGMQWVNVCSFQEFKSQAATDYVVESIPTNYLIDCSNGVIVAKNLRGEAVSQKLAELLK